MGYNVRINACQWSINHINVLKCSCTFSTYWAQCKSFSSVCTAPSSMLHFLWNITIYKTGNSNLPPYLWIASSLETGSNFTQRVLRTSSSLLPCYGLRGDWRGFTPVAGSKKARPESQLECTMTYTEGTVRYSEKETFSYIFFLPSHFHPSSIPGAYKCLLLLLMMNKLTQPTSGHIRLKYFYFNFLSSTHGLNGLYKLAWEPVVFMIKHIICFPKNSFSSILLEHYSKITTYLYWIYFLTFYLCFFK